MPSCSLGLSLTDTLDDLINEGRIEPQLAMRILSTFDRVITEVLAEKVRARLTFKVLGSAGCSRLEGSLTDTGPSGHLPILRRGLDLPYQRRQLQAR